MEAVEAESEGRRVLGKDGGSLDGQGTLRWGRKQESRAHSCLPKPGWGDPKAWAAWDREALREKMARGNSLDEGGAMENGNTPKFWRG